METKNHEQKSTKKIVISTYGMLTMGNILYTGKKKEKEKRERGELIFLNEMWIIIRIKQNFTFLSKK